MVKSDKDNEKKKALELHDVKLSADCKAEKDQSRAEMLA